MSSQKPHSSKPVSFDEAVKAMIENFEDLDFEPSGVGGNLPGDHEALRMADALMEVVTESGEATWRDLVTYGTAKLLSEIENPEKLAQNLVCMSAIFAKFYEYIGAECYAEEVDLSYESDESPAEAKKGRKEDLPN